MLNKWEKSIVDRLRYGLQNRQAVTLGADEVHIAMNAIEENAQLKERCAAAEADMVFLAGEIGMDGNKCHACGYCDGEECVLDGSQFNDDGDCHFTWSGTQPAPDAAAGLMLAQQGDQRGRLMAGDVVARLPEHAKELQKQRMEPAGQEGAKS